MDGNFVLRHRLHVWHVNMGSKCLFLIRAQEWSVSMEASIWIIQPDTVSFIIGSFTVHCYSLLNFSSNLLEACIICCFFTAHKTGITAKVHDWPVRLQLSNLSKSTLSNRMVCSISTEWFAHPNWRIKFVSWTCLAKTKQLEFSFVWWNRINGRTFLPPPRTLVLIVLFMSEITCRTL